MIIMLSAAVRHPRQLAGPGQADRTWPDERLPAGQRITEVRNVWWRSA